MTTDRPIIQVDPAVRFGQPHIRGITATIVGEHLQAGDPVETVTDEYGLTRADGLAHRAAFPTELPRRIISGWSPSGICTACGEGRRPVVDKVRHMKVNGKHRGPGGATEHLAWGIPGQFGSDGSTEVTLTGEACACTPSYLAAGRNADHLADWTPPPTRPAVVVDPFGGTGTTALVAHALGRTGITVDMSADYCRLAAWRTTDPDQLAKAMRVDKPPKQVNGQDGLFDLTGGAA